MQVNAVKRDLGVLNDIAESEQFFVLISGNLFFVLTSGNLFFVITSGNFKGIIVSQ